MISYRPFTVLASALTIILCTKIYHVSSHYSKPHAETIAEQDLAINTAQPIADQVPKVQVGDKILDGHSIYETELIADLDARLKSLIEREKHSALKTVAIEAVEAKLKQKLKQLQALEEQLSRQYQLPIDQGKSRLKRLVSIYEKMNSKKAAEIFDNLATETIMALLEEMNPSKAAPILANMKAAKAGDISKQYTQLIK